MKRPLIVIVLVALIALVVGGAERILERTLDAQLPPLLTEELGLPVTISPIRADIITLTARADRYQMDGVGEPALIAEQVMVSLNWSDLLRGEIRLVTASAEDLMVKIAAWPRDDEPLPPDYLFLEQWLPRAIDLAQGRYIMADGTPWPIQKGVWRRYKDDSASLSWQEDRPAGAFDASIELDSLDDLLSLRLFQAELAVDTHSAELPATNLSFRIEPGENGGAYRLQALGRLAGMEGTLEAHALDSWSWPERSTTHFDTLYANRVIEVIKLLYADGIEDDLEQELQSALPELSLPVHQGTITLGELRVGREMTHDNRISFNSSGKHLAITEILMGGLYGDLSGAAAVVSTPEGWDTAMAADVNARELDHGLMGRYIESHWYLERGIVRLKGKGATWGKLIDSMTGEFDLTGAHRSDEEIPVSVKAKLDGSPQEFVLEDVQVKLGESVATGRVAFTGGRERQLNLTVRSDHLDLRFLFDGPGLDPKPGMAMPEVLALFPGIEVFWDAKVADLRMPSLHIQDIVLNIDRGLERGQVVFSGRGLTGGALEVRLNYESEDPQPTRVLMTISMEQVDVDRLFGFETGVLESRTSGTLVFASQGESIPEIFEGMRGDADLTLDLRNDANWERASRPEEQVGVKGISSLIIDQNRIVGLTTEQIVIDSIEQDVSGTISIAAGRELFFIIELTSDRFNLSRVLEWVPQSAEEADEANVLAILRDLGPGKIGSGSVSWCTSTSP